MIHFHSGDIMIVSGANIRKHWDHYKDAMLHLSPERKASLVNQNKSKNACHWQQRTTKEIQSDFKNIYAHIHWFLLFPHRMISGSSLSPHPLCTPAGKGLWNVHIFQPLNYTGATPIKNLSHTRGLSPLITCSLKSVWLDHLSLQSPTFAPPSNRAKESASSLWGNTGFCNTPVVAG